MKKQNKKLIAPIVISVLFVIYFIVYFGFLITFFDGFWKYALGIIPITLSILMIAVCVERIKEIRSGEEDDLSKY